MQLFCDAKREEVKADHPDAAFGEISKLLGAAWKEAHPDEKATFQEQHAVSAATVAFFRPSSCLWCSMHLPTFRVQRHRL